MRFKITLTALFYFFACLQVIAQEIDTMPVGIHQAENEYYSAIFGAQTVPAEVFAETPSVLKSKEVSELTHMVYGWHPYWANASAYLSYDYEALTHIAYFCYEVDTATGGYATIRGWDTTPLIDYAHQHGVKVTLTVSNFGSLRNTELLTDTVKQWVLINTLIDLLRARNGDGVNFDFESMPAEQKENMVSFCRRAVRGIKAQLPGAEISLATPPVNWSDGWDLRALAGICDYLIMMGYNYYWSGSSTAGPVSPLAGENHNITRSIDEDYLADGVPPGKLLLGVPWYGYDWPVTGSERKAPTTGTGTSRTYNSALLLAGNYTMIFDAATSVPWISYQNSTEWRQMWYDDSLSLQMKSELAKSKNLAGIGIWALSYEAGRDELWNGIKEAFSENPTSADEETLHDPGAIIKIVPNPVSEESMIQYSILQKCHVTIRIYDTEGRLTASIVDRTMEPGSYYEPIHAETFANGIFICILKTPSGKTSAKFAVIKDR